MVGGLLLRGMLVGVIAGLLAFGFAHIFGEPEVDRAVSFELMTKAGPHNHSDAVSHSAVAEPEPELVSRETQAGLGLLTGIVVYGASIGGLFALVFAFACGRVGHLGPRATAALLALGAYVSVVLVPDIKYPANPPAIGNPDTIASRTGLFFLMILISVAALVLAVALAQHLRARFGAWNATIAAGAGFVAVIAVAIYGLPPVNEVPDQFSAVVLWRFRAASLGIHAVLWTIIGLLFGALTERALTTQADRSRAARSPAR